ncbi:MAG: hypothetical protein Ta2D_09760 [Rickettsiales bacterium]|nr:MAG: hypothetical protein Ta2D_09760 [Rickettsiales bacterium]
MSGQLKVKVVSKSGIKSVVGLYTFTQKHPKYEKYVKKQKRYMIHDESDEVKVGEEVFIEECRPISKNKSWKVVRG